MTTITMTLMYRLEMSNLLNSLRDSAHRVNDPHVTIARGYVTTESTDYEASPEEVQSVIKDYADTLTEGYRSRLLDRPSWLSAHGLSFFHHGGDWVPVLLVRDRNGSLYEDHQDAARHMSRFAARDNWQGFAQDRQYDYVPHMTVAHPYVELADAVDSMRMLAVPNVMDVGLPVTSVVLAAKTEDYATELHAVWRTQFDPEAS
jgi:2'-5' RNA ligase